MKNLRFEDLPKAIELILEKVENLQMQLNHDRENQQMTEQVELMTRQEVAELFRVSLPTVIQWSKSGILKSYRIGNRIYYKRSEIIGVISSKETQL